MGLQRDHIYVCVFIMSLYTSLLHVQIYPADMLVMTCSRSYDHPLPCQMGCGAFSPGEFGGLQSSRGVIYPLQFWPLRVINGHITPITKVIDHYNPIYNC